jgi:hypothetical protein
MGLGNLVEVTTPSSVGGSVTFGYLVAEQDADRAVNIIKSKIAKLTDEVVAVSRVSEELLASLGVAPGEIRRAEANKEMGAANPLPRSG